MGVWLKVCHHWVQLGGLEMCLCTCEYPRRPLNIDTPILKTTNRIHVLNVVLKVFIVVIGTKSLILLANVGGEAVGIAAEGAAKVEGGAEQQSQADCRAGKVGTEDETVRTRGI